MNKQQVTRALPGLRLRDYSGEINDHESDFIGYREGISREKLR